MQVPTQSLLISASRSHQIIAMVKQQPQIQLHPASSATGSRSTPSPTTARATANASIGSDLPRSLADRRVPAINRGATRTTRSPRATKSRSKRPDTCRQSSIAQTRSGSAKPRPHDTASIAPACVEATVRTPIRRPVAASTATNVCDDLCVSAPITIMCNVPFLDNPGGGPPADTPQSGRSHAPIKSRR